MSVLPLRYIVRNLGRRPLRSLVTIVGVALCTLLVVVIVAFARALQRAAVAGAGDDAVVLLGAAAEIDLVRSIVPCANAEVAAASMPGVRTVDGRRAASVELHIATRKDQQVGLLRGVTDAAYAVHPQLTVVEGREPRQRFEIMVGRLAGPRMGLAPDEVAVGRTIELEQHQFLITGRFVAPGTALEAELWARLEDLMLATRRDSVSCVIARLQRPEDLTEVQLFAARRLDLELSAVPQRELLQQVERGLQPIVALSHWLAVLAVLAGALACANTMFAAVLARGRELATLRALGHGPVALVCGLLQEAMLVGLLGGGVGCLLATGLGHFVLRYPMGALTLEADPGSRVVGLLTAVGAGVLGGAVPALRAVRIPLLEAIGDRT